jgi:phosphatidylglycerophosphate synthase
LGGLVRACAVHRRRRSTDWFDGYLAPAVETGIASFGTMLDPIADKAMVVIALSDA